MYVICDVCLPWIGFEVCLLVCLSFTIFYSLGNKLKEDMLAVGKVIVSWPDLGSAYLPTYLRYLS